MSSNKPLELLDFQIEILEAIFRFMPFYALLYLSHTCKILHKIIIKQPSFQKNLKHIAIIYDYRILHCTNDYSFLEDFPKTVIDEGFDNTISPAIKERFNRIKKLELDFYSDWKISPIIIKFCESIEYLTLYNCDCAKNMDWSFLKNLVNLKYLFLRDCTGLSQDNIEVLKLKLSECYIEF